MVLGFWITPGDFWVLKLPHCCSPWLPRFPGASSSVTLVSAQALIDILCLDALAIGTVCSWYRIHRTAALLLLPYLGWLAMATCLTIRIWKDNPEQKPGKSE